MSNLTTNVNGAIRAALSRARFAPSRMFVLGVSGGPDSQVLLKAFSHVARNAGHSVVAVGVNHGLRPEADAELDFAESLAFELGCEFRRVKIELEFWGKEPSNIQATARNGRYAALRLVKEELGAEAIVTAHHADDRAETVLLRLLRSAGARSLAVLPERAGDVFRPLLRVPRSALLAYARRWDLQFAQDPSNSNERYQRVWVRKQLIPLLEQQCPDIMEKLNVVADDLLDVYRP